MGRLLWHWRNDSRWVAVAFGLIGLGCVVQVLILFGLAMGWVK